MEGQFLEVYNEVVSCRLLLGQVCTRARGQAEWPRLQINDLLGSGQFDTKKHEIKLDKEGKMSVTDVVSSESDSCTWLQSPPKEQKGSLTTGSPAQQPSTGSHPA